MPFLRSFLLVFFTAAVFTSCTDEATKSRDTLSAGTIDISVDETYRPVIEEQLKVFDSAYPNAHITAHYEPESECFKDYFDNKARIILVTRQLTKDEKVLCEQKKIFTSSQELAQDAIAVIVNNASSDSMLGISELQGILTGIYKKKYTVVFDNQGSSMVRYITDSLLQGKPLGSNVFAAKGNAEVVDYVAKNPDAIGFVGVGYVSDTSDKTNTGAFISNVKLVSVQNDSTRLFYLPYQAHIALRQYPLTRVLYYVSREPYPGLGTGFANFLTMARGQLIFAHANLFPLKMNVVIRTAEIKQ